MRMVLRGRELSRFEIGQIYFARRGKQEKQHRWAVDKLTRAEGRSKRICDLIIQDRYIKGHS